MLYFINNKINIGNNSISPPSLIIKAANIKK